MKRLFSAAFVAVVLLGSFAHAAPQAEDRLSGSKRTSLSYVENAADASVTLVSAVSGQYVNLYRIIISAETADNVYLKCGSTQKSAKAYLGATSGLDTTFYPFYLRCGSGEALSIVKGTASTPIGVTLWFTQEP
jgi:hypothetical protein